MSAGKRIPLVPSYSQDLEQRVLFALLHDCDEGKPDWEGAIETVLAEWKFDTSGLTRDDAVNVVEHIAAKYDSISKGV